MSKRLFLLLMLLSITALVAACGGAQEEAQQAVEEAQEQIQEASEEVEEAMEEAEEQMEETVTESGALDIEPIRIAIVMPSTTTDLAWSQAIYDALLQIQEEAGGEDVVEIAFSESMFNVTDAAEIRSRCSRPSASARMRSAHLRASSLVSNCCAYWMVGTCICLPLMSTQSVVSVIAATPTYASCPAFRRRAGVGQRLPASACRACTLRRSLRRRARSRYSACT